MNKALAKIKLISRLLLLFAAVDVPLLALALLIPLWGTMIFSSVFLPLAIVTAIVVLAGLTITTVGWKKRMPPSQEENTRILSIGEGVSSFPTLIDVGDNGHVAGSLHNTTDGMISVFTAKTYHVSRVHAILSSQRLWDAAGVRVVLKRVWLRRVLSQVCSLAVAAMQALVVLRVVPGELGYAFSIGMVTGSLMVGLTAISPHLSAKSRARPVLGGAGHHRGQRRAARHCVA